MKTLCKKGLHLTLNYGTETGKKPSEFRLYRACSCKKKKKYLYNGNYITDKTLTERASH